MASGVLGLVNESESARSQPCWWSSLREVRLAEGWHCPLGPRVGQGEAPQHLRAWARGCGALVCGGVGRQMCEPEELVGCDQRVQVRAKYLLFVEGEKVQKGTQVYRILLMRWVSRVQVPT